MLPFLKKYLASMVVVVVGAGLGVMLNFLDIWSWVEPITGTATIALSVVLWIRTAAIERRQDSMEQKPFQLTIGLLEGYDSSAVTHPVSDAILAYETWMQNRVALGQPVITGMVAETTLVYPVRNGEDGSRVIREPNAVISGSLSPKYDRDRADREVESTLGDLARFAGTALGQCRVYASYCGRQWTIEM